MFALILTVFKTAGKWVLTSGLFKILLAGVIVATVFNLNELILFFVPSFTPINLNLLPSGVLYFMDVFALPYGLNLMISAAIARWIIRKIPGIS